MAFGSEAWDVFSKVNETYGNGIPVLIYSTVHHGDPDHLARPGYATFRAVYLGITPAQAGKHPNPSIRPAATLEGPGADTAWSIFWEVSDLVQLEKQDHVAIIHQTAEGQRKPLTNRFVLHGPMLVKAAFLWREPPKPERSGKPLPDPSVSASTCPQLRTFTR